jgi:UDP-glucose 4-epimerase
VPEEMVKAQDMGNFSVPADNRDLNYAKYFIGRRRDSEDRDYHSHNADQQRLRVEEIDLRFL